MSASPVRLLLAYDGTDFSGWQVQPGRRTVQGLVQGRLTEMLGSSVTLHGAGRTDAGVHASGQVAHFAPSREIPLDGYRRGLNAMLPPEVRVLEAATVPESFHARKSARAKVYRYQIYLGEVCPPFQYRYCHHETRAVDLEAMARAGELLEGVHDFASFQASGSSVRTTLRRIHAVRVESDGPLVQIRVRGNGFLRCMVRNLAGTLLEVGLGSRPPSWVGEVLDARDRSAAGPTAPARGLFLVRVEYPGPTEILGEEEAALAEEDEEA